MTNVKCPIWRTSADNSQLAGDRVEFDSWRAGGRFSVSGSALAILENWGDDKFPERAALSQAILEANLNSTALYISTNELDLQSSLLATRSYSDRLNLLIKTIADSYPDLGESFFSHTLLSPDLDWGFIIALGWQEIDTDSRATPLLLTYLRHASRSGLVEFDNKECKLTLAGHEYAANLGLQSTGRQSIFVAMWFGDSKVNSYYRSAVKPAIEAAGYSSIRIDETHHNQRIDEQILAEIRKSKAVLVDMTCGLARPENWSSNDLVGAPRGGVYFEAGFAAGLDIPIIWTVNKERANYENVIHFDVRQYNQYRWGDDHQENLKFLQARIEATIGKGAR